MSQGMTGGRELIESDGLIEHDAVPCRAVQCRAVPCSAVQCSGGHAGQWGRCGAVHCMPCTGTLRGSMQVHCRQASPHCTTASHAFGSAGEMQTLPLHCHCDCHCQGTAGWHLAQRGVVSS
jgi:hypothetical protein